MIVVFVRNRQRRLRVSRQNLIRLARHCLDRCDSRLSCLGIIFVNDTQMAAYNERYHRTSGTTDILTFEYDGMGELVISAERAIAHARRYHTTPARELALYIVHGILHLHGYNDRTPRQRTRMRAAEQRLLARVARPRHIR